MINILFVVLVTLVYLQMKTDVRQITITEGKQAVEIKFVATMPPQFICRAEVADGKVCFINIAGTDVEVFSSGSTYTL